MGQSNIRVNTTCLVAITVVWLIFCWPWFVDGKIIPYDAKNHFYPMMRFVAQAWHSGESFAWSPHHYGGFPMMADPQSAIWTLTLWIPTLLSETPSMRLVDTIHLAHLLIGAFAIFAFGKTCKWQWDASLIAALCYMMAGASSFRLEHLLMTVSYMWLAIALWRLNATIQYGGLWRGILFGIALALLIIDRNHIAYLGTWFLFIWWLVSLFSQTSYDKFSAILKKHYPVAVGGVLALALVAVPVILLLQLAQNSNRPEFSYLDASWQSLHPASLITFVLPEYFGAFHGSARYWGPASAIWGGEKLTMHRGMLHLYSGTLPVVLIVWFGIIKRQIFASGIRFFTIASFCYLFYSLGRYTPIFRVLYELVPGVDLFRRPSDGLFLFGFTISLLCGALIEKSAFLGTPKRTVATALIPILLILGLGSVMFSIASHYDRIVDFANSLILPFIAVIMTLLLFALERRNSVSRNLAMACLAGIVAADLVYHSSNNRMNTRPDTAYRVLETTKDNLIFSEVKSLLPNKDKVGVNWRTEIIGLGPVVQNIPQIIGSQSTLGYNPLRLNGFEKHIAPNMQNNAATKRKFGDKMTGYDSTMTNKLGLRYIISGASIDMLDPEVPVKRFDLIKKIKSGRYEAHIYENKQALQRATLLNKNGKVRVTRYSNAKIHLQVDSRKADMLVLYEFDYPGWLAMVDGTPVKIFRHDDLFRAIQVPQGKSEIVFSFKPLSLNNILNAIKTLVSGR